MIESSEIKVKHEFPELEVPVIAIAKTPTGGTELFRLRRIKTPDIPGKNQWSLVDMKTYFAWEVLSWFYE